MSEAKPKTRVLTVFSLVMINIIAVDSLRTLPIGAEYGLSLVFYYVWAALFFFIPTAFVTAELATAWPKRGGIYVWVREAFGQKWGFFVIWLQWIYNIVWYPTILSFIASMIAYVINPSLIESREYMVSMLLVMFWGATLMNCWGMRLSSLVSTLGSILGTLFPMLLIILLGIYWLYQGGEIQIQFTREDIFPKIDHIHDLVLLSGILYGLVGLEMSAVHAQEVREPSKDYPRALIISAVIILLTLVFSSLAVALVVPKSELSLVAGIIQAFDNFFKNFHLAWMTPAIAFFMVIGGFSSVSTWIIGPTKGMLAAAEDGVLPPILGKTNDAGVPINILIVQGIIFSLISLVYLFLPTVSSSYWVLTELTAQLSLLMYLTMFIAAIALRYIKKTTIRPYRIPLKNLGIWFIAGIGALTCLAIIIIGFLPPSHVKIDNVFRYEAILIGGLLICCFVPFIINRYK